jgi:hypothetical protein
LYRRTGAQRAARAGSAGRKAFLRTDGNKDDVSRAICCVLDVHGRLISWLEDWDEDDRTVWPRPASISLVAWVSISAEVNRDVSFEALLGRLGVQQKLPVAGENALRQPAALTEAHVPRFRRSARDPHLGEELASLP